MREKWSHDLRMADLNVAVERVSSQTERKMCFRDRRPQTDYWRWISKLPTIGSKFRGGRRCRLCGWISSVLCCNCTMVEEEPYLNVINRLYLLIGHECLNQTAHNYFELCKACNLRLLLLIYNVQATVLVVSPGSHTRMQYLMKKERKPLVLLDRESIAILSHSAFLRNVYL